MGLLKYQRSIGIISMLSALFALFSMLLVMVAVNYNFDAFADPLLILGMKDANAVAARWSMVLDMFGYYLLLLPVIYLLNDWLRQKSPWNNFISFNGLAYVLIGSIGAAILSVVWPYIITAYPTATPVSQEILKANFKFANDMVYAGMWNLLEMLFAGTWWFCCGIILYRNNFSKIGALTIATGIFSLADGISGIFQLTGLHEIALNLYLILAIVWAFVFGLFLLRKPFS